ELRLQRLSDDAGRLRGRAASRSAGVPDFVRHVGVDVEEVVVTAGQPGLIDDRLPQLPRQELDELSDGSALAGQIQLAGLEAGGAFGLDGLELVAVLRD